MALQITRVPLSLSSMQGDCIFTVLDSVAVSDPVNYPRFKYAAQIYIGGSLVATISKVPNPDTGVGVFNIGQIIRNYCVLVFNPTFGPVQAQELGIGVFWLNLDVHFGEQYDDANGIPTLHSGLANATGYKFFNSYDGRLRGEDNILSNVKDKPATKRLTAEVLIGSQYLFIPYFPAGGSTPMLGQTGPFPVKIDTFSGTPLSFTVSPSHQFDMQILNFSPQAVNQLQPGTITNATQYYRVTIGSAGVYVDVSVVCDPVRTPYMVHFLNQYGAFESKLFNKLSRRTYDITRSSFGKLAYTIGADGSVSYRSGNNVYNETESTYAVQFKEKMLLSTDLLDDVTYRWLRDLVVSPMVYLEENGLFYPVSITDNDYEPKKVFNDGLTALQINIEFGDSLASQYR
jgi:hypothetical protein